MSITKATYSLINGAPANVLDYGADAAGASDSSSAIQAALAAADHVFVPSGIYRCDAMIELNTNKTLELAGGAILQRYSAHSASTDPVVWVKGSNASLFGAGQSASNIVSQNRAPKGVVRLGHKDMTESHADVTYCTLRDFCIVGAVAYGQTTGSPDACLYMPNPQFSGLTSYFHTICNLRLAQANYGMWMHGWANGNTISNIQGIKLGNTTLGANTNAFIYCHGALDNSFSGAFFHDSPDSIGLLVNTMDNTGGGGSLHVPAYNSWRGIVCEQGGASALGLKTLSGSTSYYEIKDNVAGGNSLHATFSQQNNFLLTAAGSPLMSGVTTQNVPTFPGLLLQGSVSGLDVVQDTVGAVGNSFQIRQRSGNRNIGIMTYGTGIVVVGAGGVDQFNVGYDGTIYPDRDNVQQLGSSSRRWSVVYAGTGTINTSDEREKQDIDLLDEAEKRVSARLKGLIKKFRFKDAVDGKGDAARIHVGVIAQDVMAAFQAEGLDPMRYGIVCYDNWGESPERRDEDGNIIEAYRQAGSRYGVRYEELLAFIIGAI